MIAVGVTTDEIDRVVHEVIYAKIIPLNFFLFDAKLLLIGFRAIKTLLHFISSLVLFYLDFCSGALDAAWS